MGVKKKKTDEPTLLSGLGDVGTMGTHLVVCTLVGLFLGYKLDQWLGTRPWFLIIFLLAGIVAGFKNIYVQAKRSQAADEDREKTREEHD